MKKYQVPTLVFSSSATVYAPTNPCPLREEMPREATNPYGRTKVQIEEILEDVVRAGDIERAVCLRYFNPIGAHPSGQIGESPVGIPNNLMPYICQVADGTRKELHVFGNDYDTPDGTGVRDYIHVQDLAVGHALAIEKVEKAGFYAYNLGTGAGTGVLELVHAFEEATGVEIPYVIDERRAGDVARLIANCDRAREELGFTAERTVQEACASAWNYQKNEPSFS